MTQIVRNSPTSFEYEERRHLGQFRSYWGFWLAAGFVGVLMEALLGPPPGSDSVVLRIVGLAIMIALIVALGRVVVMSIQVTPEVLKIDSTGMAPVSIQVSSIRSIGAEKTVRPGKVLAPMGFSRPAIRKHHGIVVETKENTSYIFASNDRLNLLAAVERARSGK